MTQTKFGESQMSTKKAWTPPVLNVILLNSAKAGGSSHPDSSVGSKS